MTEKEKKAIEKLKNGETINIYTLLRTLEKEGTENFVITRKQYIQTILNLIQSQQKEIEKNKEFIDYLQNRNIKHLDTIIYMVNFINDNTPYTRDTKELENEEGIRTVDFTIRYFEKKVEGK